MKKKSTPPEPPSILDTEAEVPTQDPASRERQQEAEALLQILALGEREIEAGQTEPAEEVIARLRQRYESA